MLHSLLVPLDGSEFSERSLPVARRIANATGAEMHLAHVHVPYEPDHLLSNTQFHFEGLDMSEYDDRHRDSERKYLAEVVNRLGEDGTAADSRLLEGKQVAGELADYADEVKTDMIFITTHGHSGVSRLWLGSVADTMVRNTSVPLFVIHPDHPGGVPADVIDIKHILVPLDGSALAETILRPVKEVASATGADITLVHVVATRPITGPRFFHVFPDTFEPALDGALEYLDRVAQGLRDEGFSVKTRAEHAEAIAPTLAEVAKDVEADVIALATHGYGGLRRTLLGSVADKVLRSSPLPLIVMRPE